MLIDLRTREEYAQGHLKGAINIPHDEFIKRWRAGDLPKEEFRAHCNSGNRTRLVKALTDAEITDVQEEFDEERSAGRLVRD